MAKRLLRITRPPAWANLRRTPPRLAPEPPKLALIQPRRSPNAIRQQRRRARARRGEVIAPVPVCAATLDCLIQLHWLDEAAAADRVAIGDAIHRLLSDLSRHR